METENEFESSETTSEFFGTLLVPDYYPDFLCKGGACRNTCCFGWSIAISMAEYYRLLGLDCSPSLRYRLDGAFRIAEHPTEERYALLTPDYNGHCQLQCSDGFCSLQRECGEQAISATCRCYPRGLRSDGKGGYECSCSASCELVPELFFRHPEPMTFFRIPLSFPAVNRPEEVRLPDNAARIRQQCITFMQSRNLPVAKRFSGLASFLYETEASLTGKSDFPEESLYHTDLNRTLSYFAYLTAYFENNSRSVHDLCEKARTLLKISADGTVSGDTTTRYASASVVFNCRFPKWEILFEHLLVNRMFFEQFPFCENHETFFASFRALCAVYGFVRFIAVGASPVSEDDLADLIAFMFRLIDHTSFDKNANILLQRAGAGQENWKDLICL